jgi:hypothetical protein
MVTRWVREGKAAAVGRLPSLHSRAIKELARFSEFAPP